MSIDHCTDFPRSAQRNTAAKRLNPETRQQIAVAALAGKDNVSELSRQHSTSRKFVYAQTYLAGSIQALFCHQALRPNGKRGLESPIPRDFLSPHKRIKAGSSR